MTLNITDTSTPTDAPESEAEEVLSQPDELVQEPESQLNDDGSSLTANKKARRVLTPEQHQQKLLRDRASREKRAKKAKSAQESLTAQEAPKAVPLDESLTQEQRDIPYRRRLSAQIQAADKARFNRVMDSQRRRAEGKDNSSQRGSN